MCYLISFQINTPCIPAGFLKADVRSCGRHLILATDEQLEILCNALEWYVDGTFDLVKKPFYQLYSIHAFILNEDGMRTQVALVYILMSGKSRAQYVEVGIILTNR